MSEQDLAWLDEHLERAWCSDLALSPDWTCERCGDRGHCACWHGACHFCGSKDHSGDTATRIPWPAEDVRPLPADQQAATDRQAERGGP